MSQENPIRKIPVILDTDIGGDIDDTWALAMMLNSPELDIKFVLTENGDTLYRARIVAKMLEVAGRTDVPVGIGIRTPPFAEPETWPQEAWVEGYDIGKYPGKVYDDGVGAMVDMIMQSEEQVTLIAIGPLTNIADALQRQPEVASKVRFVGMHGNIRTFFADLDKVVPEYNVKCDPLASRRVFEAPWDMTITPLDTCGKVILKGDRYAKVFHSNKPLARVVMENYKAWVQYLSKMKIGMEPDKFEHESSTLFDCVAVYLAFREDHLYMETLGIRVLDDGLTAVDEKAKKVHCAMDWKDMDAFMDFLVERIIG